MRENNENLSAVNCWHSVGQYNEIFNILLMNDDVHKVFISRITNVR